MFAITELSKMSGNYAVIPPFSMTIQPGSSTAIQCTAEASRMLMDILLGRTSVSTGNIRLNDKPWSSRDGNMRSLTSFVLRGEKPQQRLQVLEYATYWKKMMNAPCDVQAALERVGLQSRKQTLIADLASSEQKRLLLVRCMLQCSDIVILEEPGQNMDQESFSYLTSVIDYWAESGKMVLITTSSAEQAQLLGREWYRLSANGLVSVQDEPAAFSFDMGKIPAKSEDRIMLFNAPEINYVESRDGATLLYVNGTAYACAMNLGQLENRLQPFGFYRCHRSYLVNLQQVREIEAWSKDSYILKLDDSASSKVPLSKTKFAELKQLLGL